jgi:hypothetical protein
MLTAEKLTEFAERADMLKLFEVLALIKEIKRLRASRSRLAKALEKLAENLNDNCPASVDSSFCSGLQCEARDIQGENWEAFLAKSRTCWLKFALRPEPPHES